MIRLRAMTMALLLLWATTAQAGTTVENIRIWAESGKTRVVLDLSNSAEHNIFTLRGPDRLVIDLKNSRFPSSEESTRSPRKTCPQTVTLFWFCDEFNGWHHEWTRNLRNTICECEIMKILPKEIFSKTIRDTVTVTCPRCPVCRCFMRPSAATWTYYTCSPWSRGFEIVGCSNIE
jgi:hypothetical protein